MMDLTSRSGVMANVAEWPISMLNPSQNASSFVKLFLAALQSTIMVSPRNVSFVLVRCQYQTLIGHLVAGRDLNKSKVSQNQIQILTTLQSTIMMSTRNILQKL